MGLHWIDGVIIAAYACGMIVFGFCYTRRQRSTSEFFTGAARLTGAAERSLGEWPTRPVPAFISVCLTGAVLSAAAAEIV